VAIPLHRGDAAQALTIFSEAWPKLKKTMLLRVPVIRGMAYDLLGRSALATAFQDTSPAPELKRTVHSCAKSLRKEVDPWSHGLAAALSAGCAMLEDKRELARKHLTLAVEAQTTRGMDLYAAAARAKLAELEPPERASELLRDAESTMAAAGVQNPARISMLVPIGS
jgi:hypothetical protein